MALRNLSYGFLSSNDLIAIYIHGNALKDRMFTKRLQTICRKAGITKNVTPHLFRHSRITHLIQEGLSERVIKKMM